MKTRCQGLVKQKCGYDACFVSKLPSSGGAQCKQTCLECAHDWLRQFVTHVDNTWNVKDRDKNYIIWKEQTGQMRRPTLSTISDLRIFIVMTMCETKEEKVYSIGLPLNKNVRWEDYQDLLYRNMEERACKSIHFVVDFDVVGIMSRVPESVIARAITQKFPDPRIRKLMLAGGRLQFDSKAEVLAVIFDNSVRSANQLPILYLTLRAPLPVPPRKQTRATPQNQPIAKPTPTIAQTKPKPTVAKPKPKPKRKPKPPATTSNVKFFPNTRKTRRRRSSFTNVIPQPPGSEQCEELKRFRAEVKSGLERYEDTTPLPQSLAPEVKGEDLVRENNRMIGTLTELVNKLKLAEQQLADTSWDEKIKEVLEHRLSQYSDDFPFDNAKTGWQNLEDFLNHVRHTINNVSSETTRNLWDITNALKSFTNVGGLEHIPYEEGNPRQVLKLWTDHLSTVREGVVTCADNLRVCNANRDKLNQEVARLRKTAHDNDVELKRQKVMIDNNEIIFNEMKLKSQTLERTSESFKKQLAEQKRKYESELKSTRADLDALTTKNKDVTNRISLLSSDIREKNNELTHAAEDLEACERRYNNEKSKLTQIKRFMRQNCESESVEKLLNELKEEYKYYVAETPQDGLRASVVNIGDLSHTVKQKNQEIETLRKNLQETSTRLEQKTKELAQLQQEMDDTKLSIQALNLSELPVELGSNGLGDESPGVLSSRTDALSDNDSENSSV